MEEREKKKIEPCQLEPRRINLWPLSLNEREGERQRESFTTSSNIQSCRRRPRSLLPRILPGVVSSCAVCSDISNLFLYFYSVLFLVVCLKSRSPPLCSPLSASRYVHWYTFIPQGPSRMTAKAVIGYIEVVARSSVILFFCFFLLLLLPRFLTPQRFCYKRRTLQPLKKFTKFVNFNFSGRWKYVRKSEWFWRFFLMVSEFNKIKYILDMFYRLFNTISTGKSVTPRALMIKMDQSTPPVLLMLKWKKYLFDFSISNLNAFHLEHEKLIVLYIVS